MSWLSRSASTDGGRHHEQGTALAQPGHPRHHVGHRRVGNRQRAAPDRHGVDHGGLVTEAEGSERRLTQAG